MSWNHVPLRHLTQVLSRGTAPDYVDDGPVRMVSQAANQDEGLDWNRTRFHQYQGHPRSLKGYLEPGDTLVNSTGTGTLGRVGWFDKGPDDRPCVADGHVTVVRFDRARINSRFGYYYLRSSAFQDLMFETLVAGSTNQIELNRERMRGVQAPAPPLEEQRRIADFLDAETSRIDELIAKKRRLVALLEERVDHAISMRIAESPLVDSQSESAGIPIRNALRKLARPPQLEDVVTAFRDGQVTARSLRRADGYTESWTAGAQMQGIARGDVVVHGLDGFAGAIGAAEADGVCSPVYHVCAPTDGGDADYLGRLLRNLAISGYLELFATSTRERAVDFRNWRRFGRIPIPNVDPTEQRAIGNRIRKIKPLEVAVERSAELAMERRQALITAAVTGQLDVTTAVGDSGVITVERRR